MAGGECRGRSRRTGAPKRERKGRVSRAYRRAAGDLTLRKPRKRRAGPKLRRELWRWHRQRVFVHQFNQMALPLLKVTTQKVSAAWDYRNRFETPKPSLGLAAAKHQQFEEKRRRMGEDFRLVASIKRRRRVDENEVSKAGRLNTRELSLLARSSPELTLYEQYLFHLRNGTADQFLKSLKHT